MGIYLGQLPPAEIARLKAELAETIIGNFCYPRFFDYRTNSLRMRPVDRTKRQEVWLYLSSVDFTAWNRVDVMSPDLQRYIERLFIQFVQRNRNFFGQQGRKRMPDVRTLITTSSTTVVQSLRTHVSGQRQERQPFGSPRPVIAWSAMTASGGRADLSWEQVSAMTLLLQQQLQEMRGEAKTPSVQEVRTSQSSESVESPVKRNGRTASPRTDHVGSGTGRTANSPATSEPNQGVRGTTPFNPASPPTMTPPQPVQPARVAPNTPVTPAASAPNVTSPNGVGKRQESSLPTVSLTDAPARASSFTTQSTDVTSAVSPAPPAPPAPPASPAPTVQHAEPLRTTYTPPQGNGITPPATPHTPPVVAIPTVSPSVSSLAPQASAIANTPTQPGPPVQLQSAQARIIAQPVQIPPGSPDSVAPPVASPVASTSPVPLADAMVEQRESRDMHMMSVGDEDIAIFEQLRHQVILWLRVEAVHAGIEMTGQGPAQLLDQLRRQERFDETRLQVVSTLLNLANQVIKNKRVSVLDYKQALMFHLMHTRR